jgi:hypothetical protein
LAYMKKKHAVSVIVPTGGSEIRESLQIRDWSRTPESRSDQTEGLSWLPDLLVQEENAGAMRGQWGEHASATGAQQGSGPTPIAPGPLEGVNEYGPSGSHRLWGMFIAAEPCLPSARRRGACPQSIWRRLSPDSAPASFRTATESRFLSCAGGTVEEGRLGFLDCSDSGVRRK